MADQSVSKEKDTFENTIIKETNDSVSAIPDSSVNSETTDNKIFIKGSDTILPVSIAESEAYMNLHSEKEIIVIGGGSSLGIASFIEGEVEIAMASRKIKESEIADATNNDINPLETVIAWDGISVIVNKNNPVESLSIEQLKNIYTGEVTNWKELGGNNEEIEVLVRDTSSGTYGFFKEHVLQDDEYSESAITEPNTEAVVQKVALDPAAIGYIGLAYVDNSVKTIGLGTYDGIFYPEAESIRKGDYPLSRPLQYYTNGQPQGTAKEYIKFVLSDIGQEIIADVGYLPVN
ncbi:phosphate ABC transporter substrate-binding protein [Methanolobus psychrotolerans]|uniref:phosphate ABC transporter substrate-binding protein n=1 Tax=Methanolobus psychrotolerans TaxID=1874706 RepID=UPI000B91B8E7|nr:phosphate ABC transporter substrate-binding protein [Methanolobus psychrotolerans]